MNEIRQFIKENEVLEFTPSLRVNHQLYLSAICVTEGKIEVETAYGWYELKPFPITIKEIELKNCWGHTIQKQKIIPFTLSTLEILFALRHHFESKIVSFATADAA